MNTETEVNIFNHFWIGLPICILIGAMTAFYGSLPNGLWMAVFGLLIVAWKLRSSGQIMVLCLAGLLASHYLGAFQLKARLAKQPHSNQLDKAFKAKVRYLYSWDTRFGKAAKVDSIEILSPESANFEIERLTLYLPETVELPKPGSQITCWFILKRRYEPQTIPWPIRRMRETWLPSFYGTVKTTALMDIKGPQYHPPDHINQANRELARAMLEGVPSKIWSDRLNPFGLGHLLAISGLHCGFVFLGLNLILFNLRRPLIRTALVISGMLLFADHMGWTTSVTRATLMLCLWQILPLIQRQRHWIRLWAALAALAVISDVTVLLQRGFWYSFCASLGIILGARRRETSPLVHPYLRHCRKFLPIVAAQILVTPINLLFDAQTRFSGLIWNMLGLLFLILIGLLLGVVILAWHMPLMAPMANRAESLLANLFDVLPSGDSYILTRFPSQPLTALVVVIGLGLIMGFVKREWRWYGLLLCVTGFCCLGRPTLGSKVVMLDVGQGQCIMSTNEAGDAWLYDAGGRLPAGLRLDQVLYLLGVRKLRGVIISHHNWDHYNLLLSLPKAPPTIWVPPKQRTAFDKNPAFPATFLFSSSPLPNRFGDLQLKQLWPSKIYEPPNNNEDSWVLELAGRDQSTLILTGDAGQWTESRLVLNPALLERAVILQLGHHGSRSSTSEAFLEQLGVDIALISCGRRNPFGHPHQYVLERLNKRKIPIFNTSLGGSVQIYEKGKRKVSYIENGLE